MKRIFKTILILLISFNIYACTEENITEENNTNTTSSVSLVSDNTKKVYKESNTYHVYYYDKDGKITGYEQYIEYDLGVTASYILGDINETYSKDENVDEIKTIEKYILVKYKPSKYKNLNLDNLVNETITYEEIN